MFMSGGTFKIGQDVNWGISTHIPVDFVIGDGFSFPKKQFELRGHITYIIVDSSVVS